MEHRRLVLLRHAKSSWAQPDIDDHDRPLNARGRRAAAWVGQHLREQGIAFDVVLCSSAARTVETLALLSLDESSDINVERGLYGATADEMVARLRQLRPDAATALLIAHNPGIHELAVTLTNDDPALGSFPTAALADLLMPARSWAELGRGAMKLEAFVTPTR